MKKVLKKHTMGMRGGLPEKRCSFDRGKQSWFILVIFLMTLACSLAVAGATGISDNEVISLIPETDVLLQTRVYTLVKGEDVNSVARTYNITLDTLRQLNQFRTFAHGFDHLQAGDEIDVPLAPLPAVLWEDSRSLLSNDDERNIAGFTRQTGELLGHGNTEKQAADLAYGMVTGAASGKFESWLSKFGTAQARFGADQHFSLKQSEFDLLLPWYETRNNLLFTQYSLHRTDDRTQLNIGAGLRHFYDAAMTGLNLFVDHDLSRYHSRAGLGAEYWRDYLKFSGNGYIGLTGWRDAPELDKDYDARPANGWDLRAEAWLPAFPQLGGKLLYEQYYGNDVALSVHDRRQKNPHALTAGISYTPFPLLTFSAEQRQGESEMNDSRFGLEISYQPGVALSQQVDPDKVSFRRSLAGARHDLVERNNHIVLDYRKKTLVKLLLSDEVTGRTGEQKPLVSALQTKYPLKKMIVDARTLTVAGGRYVVNGNQVMVTLPPYRNTLSPEVDNLYIVSVIAEDIKNNRSAREQVKIMVVADDVEPSESELKAEPSTIIADGTDFSTLTWMARDRSGHSVEGLKVKFMTDAGSQKKITVSQTTEYANGRYTATLKGYDVASVSVYVTANSERVSTEPVIVTLSHGGVLADNSTLTAGAETLLADGHDSVTLTYNALDKEHHPVTGMTELTLDVQKLEGTTFSGFSETSTPGVYIGTLSGTHAGVAELMPQLSGENVAKATVSMTFVAQVNGIHVNSYTFTPDAGFPKTGFKGAVFTLQLSGASVADYNWTSDAPSWISVNEGEVRFIGEGTGKKVTVKATPVNGRGAMVTYTFRLSSWYSTTNVAHPYEWQKAGDYCSHQPGYSLPQISQVTGQEHNRGVRGHTGALWSEWGDMKTYDVGFVIYDYWMSDPAAPDNHFVTNLTDGYVRVFHDETDHFAVCRKPL